MNPDLETYRANVKSLIAMWQDEEKRLRSILEDPQTSPSIEHQVRDRLAAVLDQLKSLANELDALQQTN
jgi:hypothetical protein